MKTFELDIAVCDYIADNAEELEGLIPDGALYYDSSLEAWVQNAHDEEVDYLLLVAGGGNVRIEYAGSRA